LNFSSYSIGGNRSLKQLRRLLSYFDAITDVGSCIRPPDVDVPLNSLALDEPDETLGHHVVVAVVAPTCAGVQTVG
jgi:hypothetical protein